MERKDIEKLGLNKGDLVEIVLTPDAKNYVGVGKFYMKDLGNKTNLPERFHSGYITGIYPEKGYLTLHYEWSDETLKLAEKNDIEIGGIMYYFNAIDKFKRD